MAFLSPFPFPPPIAQKNMIRNGIINTGTASRNFRCRKNCVDSCLLSMVSFILNDISFLLQKGYRGVRGGAAQGCRTQFSLPVIAEGYPGTTEIAALAG